AWRAPGRRRRPRRSSPAGAPREPAPRREPRRRPPPPWRRGRGRGRRRAPRGRGRREPQQRVGSWPFSIEEEEGRIVPEPPVPRRRRGRGSLEGGEEPWDRLGKHRDLRTEDRAMRALAETRRRRLPALLTALAVAAALLAFDAGPAIARAGGGQSYSGRQS